MGTINRCFMARGILKTEPRLDTERGTDLAIHAQVWFSFLPHRALLEKEPTMPWQIPHTPDRSKVFGSHGRRP